jgi:hypothetical protein
MSHHDLMHVEPEWADDRGGLGTTVEIGSAASAFLTFLGPFAIWERP